ncbi:hypothetical protein COU20_03895 [Candidatus Kaiserbacteria bacterium CG10_big_fil_rev_8_21_14_0_10_59_10]|uniref:Transglycosylase SLT domain-containing protein n=1 Tax=Candidatus Kaiserbacteria bacterium CG10_big_fil_rev_8_21_14_0_10_59_10 TaxID=1974612 RepID=A0A2H0U777_9BACT|nr:MAG: hypothetical protein COU20_03895 [Candidatus Kaiserbacteria bacterium CG10_big_fil_rev_8_21_14_0_10_59_10]
MRIAAVLVFLAVFWGGTADAARPDLESAALTGSGNHCEDESVTAPRAGTGGKPEVKKEGADKEPTSCTCQADGTGGGTVYYRDPSGNELYTLNKCDPRYAKSIGRLRGGESMSSLLKDLAVQGLSRDAITNETSNSDLQKVLDSFDPSGALRVTDENRADVIDLLRKSAVGDTVGAQAAAKRLGLNPNLFSDVEMLQPADRFNKYSAAMSEAQRQLGQGIVRGDTFAPAATSIVNNPRGQPRYPVQNLRNGQRVDPRAIGEAAADARARVCATVRVCYVTPEAQFATLMNETNGNVRAIGDNGGSHSLAQAYARQSGFSNYLSRYRNVFGEDYVLHRINLKDRSINPEWIASQSMRMQAIILQDKAQSVGGSFPRALVAYNGSGPHAVAYGARALGNAAALQVGAANPYWQAAYNASKSGAPTITNLAAHDIPAISGLGSPFGFAGSGASGIFGLGTGMPTTIGRPASVGQPTPIGQPAGGGAPAAGAGGVPAGRPQQPLQTVPVSQILQQQGGTGQARPPVPEPAVVTIIPQQKAVSAGTPINVAWSSVGVAAVSCRVLARDSAGTERVIEQGVNEGSQPVRTDDFAAGPVTFTLRCAAAATGQPVEKSAVSEIR